MNCRRFENQVTDWLAERLTPERAQHMSDHRQACAFCARVAGAEERLRGDWRALSSPAAPDFWPRLALRLEDQRRPQRLPSPVVRRGWAWGGTAILATVAVGGLLLWPKTLIPAKQAMDGQPIIVRPVSVSALPDVAQVDPAVDDPAGTSMNNVWTQIDTAAPRVNNR